MGTVEQDTALYHAHIAELDRRYNAIAGPILEDLAHDILTGECEKEPLCNVLDGLDADTYSGLLSDLLKASGDDLILARDALYDRLLPYARERADESDELDRRVWEQDEADREGA